MRRKLEELWLRAIRAYTYNTPISKGKYRLFQTAYKLCRERHNLLTTVKDGRRFWADLSTGMHFMVFFLGEYEKETTRIVRRLLKKGDVCIDAGANFGWYTTLMAEYGPVHAFEPVPDIYTALERNSLGYDNVFLNQIALGEYAHDATIKLFKGFPDGHASLSTMGNGSSFPCKVITLDSYLEENNIGQVDFVKADIEGGELMFLKGSEKLFTQKVPPVFMMEMSPHTTKHFNYKPQELIAFIDARADYDFYFVEPIGLRKVVSFPPEHNGTNVFCVPKQMKIVL